VQGALFYCSQSHVSFSCLYNYSDLPVIGPGTELNGTRLVVERKISNIDVTRCCENSARFPVNATIVTQHYADFLEVRC